MGEMTALEYLKEKSRMTRGCGVFCDNCLLGAENNGKEVACGGLEEGFPETAIDIVQEWSEENPRKTMLQDFLEKNPKAVLDNEGLPYTCPHRLGYVDANHCDFDWKCKECWSRPVEEE